MSTIGTSSYQLTQQDLDELNNLFDTNQRTRAYLRYTELTGNDQTFETARISNFSGALGGVAHYANYIVSQEASAAGIPVPDIKQFSIIVADHIQAAINQSFDEGGGGQLTELAIARAAHEGWASLNLQEFSIPASEYIKEAFLDFYENGPNEIFSEAVDYTQAEIEHITDLFESPFGLSVVPGLGLAGPQLTPLGRELLESRGVQIAASSIIRTQFGYFPDDFTTQLNSGLFTEATVFGHQVILDQNGDIVFVYDNESIFESPDLALNEWGNTFDRALEFVIGDANYETLLEEKFAITDAMGGGIAGRPLTTVGNGPDIDGTQASIGIEFIESEGGGRIRVTLDDGQQGEYVISSDQSEGASNDVLIERKDGESFRYHHVYEAPARAPDGPLGYLIEEEYEQITPFDELELVSVAIDGINNEIAKDIINEQARFYDDFFARKIATYDDRFVALQENHTGLDLEYYVNDLGEVSVQDGQGNLYAKGRAEVDEDGNIANILTERYPNGDGGDSFTVTYNKNFLGLEDTEVSFKIGGVDVSAGYIGNTFGSNLGSIFLDGDEGQLERAVTTSLLGAVGDLLAETVAGAFSSDTLSRAFGQTLADFPADFTNNIKGAAVSIAFNELYGALGFSDSLGGQLGRTATTQLISNGTSIIANLNNLRAAEEALKTATDAAEIAKHTEIAKNATGRQMGTGTFI